MRTLQATRRPGAEGMISLRARRTWYDEDAAGQEAAAAGGNGNVSDEWKLEDLPTGAQKYIKELRAEAAERRKALEAERVEAQRREQTRLAEEGRWKELAESRAAELAKVTPYQERATALEAMIVASNKTRIERIPEDMRALVPIEYAPEKLAGWLDANLDRLLKRPAPEVDAGAGATAAGTGLPKLTEDERRIARAMGLSEEAYAKRKAELQG